jgi:hypothetical protein
MVHRLAPAEMECLVDDLGRRQIPAEAHRASRAERAGQRAAGLRREAQRATAVLVAHEDGLHRMALRRTEERLHGAVASFAFRDDLERRERHRLRERCA